jgi:nucleoside-diphosphate-sugar epimerase
VLGSPAEKVGGRVFNVGDTTQNFTKQHLVELIQPFAPDATVEYVRKTEDPRDYRVTFSRIADQLGYKISRTVAEGIGEVAHLVRENIIKDYSEERFRN